MSQLSSKLRSIKWGEAKAVSFWCPGCEEMHMIVVERWSGQGPVWGWDGNIVAPTFSPSIRCYRDLPTGNILCHSFIRNGRIEFLGDCTHSLKGQTVDLPDLPQDWLD